MPAWWLWSKSEQLAPGEPWAGDGISGLCYPDLSLDALCLRDGNFLKPLQCCLAAPTVTPGWGRALHSPGRTPTGAIRTHEVAKRVSRTSSTLELAPRGPWQSQTPRTGPTSHAGLEALGREARGRQLRGPDLRVSCPGCPNVVNLLPGGPQVPATTPAPPQGAAGRPELTGHSRAVPAPVPRARHKPARWKWGGRLAPRETRVANSRVILTG